MVSSPGWVGRLTTVDGRSAPADGLVSALPPALMDGGDFSVADVFTVGAYPHSDCGLLRMKDAETPFSGGVAPAMGAVSYLGPRFHTVLLAGIARRYCSLPFVTGRDCDFWMDG